MNNNEKQAIQHEILGELQPLFNEYVDVVDTIPADAPAVEVPYVPAVVSDRVSAALKKLTANSSYDEFTAAINKAGHSKISAREKALIDTGFVGTISKLFDSVISIDEVADDAQTINKLKNDGVTYQRIPSERRKGAKIVSSTGYYWGGIFKPFDK